MRFNARIVKKIKRLDVFFALRNLLRRKDETMGCEFGWSFEGNIELDASMNKVKTGGRRIRGNRGGCLKYPSTNSINSEAEV